MKKNIIIISFIVIGFLIAITTGFYFLFVHDFIYKAPVKIDQIGNLNFDKYTSNDYSNLYIKLNENYKVNQNVDKTLNVNNYKNGIIINDDSITISFKYHKNSRISDVSLSICNFHDAQSVKSAMNSFTGEKYASTKFKSNTQKGSINNVLYLIEPIEMDRASDGFNLPTGKSVSRIFIGSGSVYISIAESSNSKDFYKSGEVITELVNYLRT